MMISNPCCTTFRVLSEASGYFAFGVVPRTTCRPLGSRFNFSLQSSNLCRSLCYSSLTARATHLLGRTLYSVHGNRLSGLLNPRTCFQGSRNSTGLSEFCVSGETICLGERKTRQHKYSWPKKNTFPLFGAPISLLSAPSSREIFTCVSEGVWSKEAGGVLVGRLQSALTGWQPVRHKSRGKKSKYDDDEVSHCFINLDSQTVLPAKSRGKKSRYIVKMRCKSLFQPLPYVALKLTQGEKHPWFLYIINYICSVNMLAHTLRVCPYPDF